MKIVNPDNTSHSIRIITRYFFDGDFIFKIYNKSKKEELIVENYTYQLNDGFMDILFDFNFNDKDRFSFKLLDGSEILYRGMIYATAGETQDYKQSIGRYEY